MTLSSMQMILPASTFATKTMNLKADAMPQSMKRTNSRYHIKIQSKNLNRNTPSWKEQSMKRIKEKKRVAIVILMILWSSANISPRKISSSKESCSLLQKKIGSLLTLTPLKWQKKWQPQPTFRSLKIWHSSKKLMMLRLSFSSQSLRKKYLSSKGKTED